MATESELAFAKFTLLGVEGHSGFLDTRECCLKSLIILSLVPSKDENVIHLT